MIQGYQDFYYNVQDMKRAIQFYERAFGMVLEHGHEFWATLRLDNLSLGLHWTEGKSVPPISHDRHGAHCGGTLTLRSDSIEDDKRRIEIYGGKVLSDSKQAWGHMLVFQDPDGNILKLMNPKVTG